MGYSMSQKKCTVWINHKSVRDALKAVKALHGKESITDGSGRHFSWVTQDFHKANDFKEIMDHWRWKVIYDEDGNVVDLYFEGEKLGDDLTLLNAIAPFVDKGSYIEMHGEDGAIWRWVFDGKTCVEKAPKVTW